MLILACEIIQVYGSFIFFIFVLLREQNRVNYDFPKKKVNYNSEHICLIGIIMGFVWFPLLNFS